jgi:integrase-like protein
MIRCPSLLRNFMPLAGMLLMCLMDAWRFLLLCLRPSPALAAENLFLRKQLALYQERQIKPRRPTQATRMALAWLAHWFDDQRMRNLGLRVLKTPMRSPKANSLCERLLGTLRRECLDLMIPLTEGHLRRILYEWVCHYNAGRPHMALGPGIPQPPVLLPVPLQVHRHRLPEPLQIVAHPILGGLHQENQLIEKAV